MFINKVIYRLPIMATAIVMLLVGLLSGLSRIGWPLFPLSPDVQLLHGPLMTCGFLGTLIGMERAVAFRQKWAYLSPITMALGAIILLINPSLWLGPALFTVAGILLTVISISMLFSNRESYMQVITLGAIALAIGNFLWLLGAPVFDVVYWWLGFLILTIAGERLELSRVSMLQKRILRLILGIVLFLCLSLAAITLYYELGVRLVGLSLVALSAWLLRYDVAKKTIRLEGLTRFIATCLLSGYVWLGLGGFSILIHGNVTAGPVYDAMLHTVLLGFVFSMIFGHAPIIFPLILDTEISYRGYFYVHLVLLHVSLVIRIFGDLGNVLELRRWGGLLGMIAIVLFLIVTVSSTIIARNAAQASEKEKGVV